MGLSKLYRTSEQLASAGAPMTVAPGVVFYVRSAKSPEFRAAFAAAVAPVQQLFDAGLLDAETQRKLFIEALAIGGITGWSTDGASYVVIDDETPSLEFSPDNARIVLSALPNLADDVWAFARERSNYLASRAERAGKA